MLYSFLAGSYPESSARNVGSSWKVLDFKEEATLFYGSIFSFNSILALHNLPFILSHLEMHKNAILGSSFAEDFALITISFFYNVLFMFMFKNNVYV